MKLVSLTGNKPDLNNMTEDQQEAYRSRPVEITAVLSQGQYNLVKTGAAEIEIPQGVEMANQAGSRTLVFACENRDIAEELMDGLDNSGISWDEDNNQDVDLADIIGEEIHTDRGPGYSSSGIFSERGQG
jgi:hypothetical protein